MLPDLPEPLPKQARSAARRLASLNLDDIIIDEGVVVAGPRDRPVGDGADLGVGLAFMQIAVAIHDPGLAANVPEDNMVSAVPYCYLAGKERSHEDLSNVALVELVMSANAPALVGSDDDDEPLEAPANNIRGFIAILDDI